MLELLLGVDWTANRQEILNRLSEDVAAGRGGRILLVPELISHDTERRLCAAAGVTASRYAEVLSFTRLGRRVMEKTGNAALGALDNGGRVVAMAAAARQLHSRLKAYAAVETRPEFLTALVDAVDEFKRCCITAGDLREAAGRTGGSFAQKLEELALILEAYDAICQRGLRDPRDQMSLVLEQMEDSGFGSDLTVYIDGFPDFTRQHLAVLEHLIRVSPRVTVSLNCDEVGSSALAFEKAGATAQELLECARRAGVKAVIRHVAPGASALASMRQGLFQGPLQPNENVVCIHAESPFAECQEAAERILALVRGGCRYRQIGVVCADPEGLSGVAELVFRRCGIPTYAAGNEEVLQRSVVGALLSALESALEGFEQRSVLRYLRSLLSPVDQDLCDRMENYAVIWGIRGNRWLKKWENHPDGLSGVWDEASRRELEALERGRALAMEPLGRLRDGFRDASDLAGQVRAVYAFLEELALADTLDAMARTMDEAGDNRSAQILNQLWEILLTALEQLHDVLGGTHWDSAAFTRLLSLLLSQYDVGTIPPVLDAVNIGSVTALRCQQVKHLFVLGAQEGCLPGYGGAGGVLTDQERTALRALDVPLTGGAMEGLQAEFAEIYGVFCGAEETVTVSYTGANPSFVCRRLRDMAGGERQAQPVLGPALTDAWEAGAWLARTREEACGLPPQVRQGYDDALRAGAHSLGRIARENVQRLYGSSLNLSASQVDSQAECRLAYFLKYGLRARERKEARVDPAEFGTYVHAVLEETVKEVMALGGFREVSLEQMQALAEKHSENYAREHFAQMDSQRMEYLFRRNARELHMVVQELWEELRTSEFAPRDFEVAFGSGGKLEQIPIPGASMEAKLRGFIDRVDTWHTAGNDYFRVVDYKTGRKDFDYCDVFNGVGLQMLLYLFALEKEGRQVVGQRPIPVGVQYFPARSPILTANGRLSDEEAQAERQKEWKRRGLLLEDEEILSAMGGSRGAELADREQLRVLEKYIFRLLAKLVDDIASGNVEPNPYTRGSSHDACAWCPYGDICHRGNVPGRRNYKTMSDRKFWEDVCAEVDHG